MDTNEKMAVKIVRDCLTTAHESLPVYASNVKRNGELGERYAVVTAEQWLDMHRVPGDESCVARLESYMTRN